MSFAAVNVTHTHALAYTYTCTQTRTYTHARTHACMHTHTLTHTHTHTLLNVDFGTSISAKLYEQMLVAPEFPFLFYGWAGGTLLTEERQVSYSVSVR